MSAAERAEYMAIRTNTREEVKSGDEIVDFRGRPAQFYMVSRIPEAASTGRVLTTEGAEFYPSVFNLVIVRRAD
jgi:hypothetical protein